MNWLKRFSVVFFSMWPLTALSVVPVAVLLGSLSGALVGGIGYSIYRSNSVLDIKSAFEFFSSCWTCQLFSNIMSEMSLVIPPIYSAIGSVVMPVSAGLLAVWFAWGLFSNVINTGLQDGWKIAGDFGNKAIKLAFVCGLLLAPLPRMVSDIAIEPIFYAGTTLTHAASSDMKDDSYAECMFVTIISDTTTTDVKSAARGAFSPKLRQGMACELAGIHQITGMGFTLGYTLMNMAFDSEYMHTIFFNIPIAPNIPAFFGGLLLLVLFFMALLPIPIFFLEIFIKLSMDLILLPLTLMNWLFQGWAIFPKGSTKSFQQIINDFIQGVLGIVMMVIFMTFAIMFINASFGNSDGGLASLNALRYAIENNDSAFIMDGFMMENHSFITLVLMGAFMAMFMTMLPTLIKTLFRVEISQDFYNKAKNDINILWTKGKALFKKI